MRNCQDLWRDAGSKQAPGELCSPSAFGALQFGLACVSLIRNPASHEDEEWDEQVALEQLAALSVFARLANECQVVNA